MKFWCFTVSTIGKKLVKFNKTRENCAAYMPVDMIAASCEMICDKLNEEILKLLDPKYLKNY